MKLFTNLFLKRKNEDEILSMAVLKKKDSKLPVNLYLDDAGIWKKSKHHLPRLKFQNNRNDTCCNTRSMIPMSISKEPEVLISLKGRRNIDLNNSDINKVKAFVSTNYDLIIKLYKDEINLGDFFNQMKTVDE